jgi:Periplasmic lysozyme inhibitor of I-type lysozyme
VKQEVFSTPIRRLTTGRKRGGQKTAASRSWPIERRQQAGLLNSHGMNAASASMIKVALSFLGILLAARIVFAAEQEHRFVQKFRFPAAPEVAVVAEGDFEPRSFGSYTLRLYGGGSGEFPTDDFIAGIVRSRNGVIEAVRLDDIDGDNGPEIIVVMRAAGSGGYLAADGFRYRNKSLEWIGSVADLDKAADPIAALREKFKAHSKR